MLGQVKHYILAIWTGLMVCSVRSEPTSQLYSAVPPLLSKSSEPLVMLVMSVDHELFKKAYPDYSDLDGDGQLDTTYNDQFDYLGYFESDWCYSYSTSSGRFEPQIQATGDNGHFCETSPSHWSGNFLNWATMSRIDILRRVLFGGKRSTDTSSSTVLERAYLPRDIHSFVKVYSEDDIDKLTPYTNGISLCNLATSENGEPKVRIARNDESNERYPDGWNRWASTEVIQCQWDNANSPSISNRLDELTVRVSSCVTGKDAVSNRCREYGSGQFKPVGLLQRYGEDGSIRFGLISGSYDNNISGGLLRRNISKIGGNTNLDDNEINLTDGTFNSSVKGIIHHINTFRIAKYSYSQNRYTDCNAPGIGISTFTGDAARSLTSNRHCSNWGNPLAEMFLEALRYFSGEASPSSQYDTDDDYFVPGITSEDWIDPKSIDNACANCSIILISTGLNSFDRDQFGAASDIPGISGVSGVHALTDEVGDIEATINPKVSFPGIYLSDKPGGNRRCEETEISKLSDISGICPELPQLQGGYDVAGLAWHGLKADLREDLDGVQNVKTYAVRLSEAIPSFSLNVDGKTVIFQPVCQAHSNRGECSLTDVIVDDLSPDKRSGRFIFTWEDSLWGSDYDYDASSSIEYCIGSACNPAIGESQVQIKLRQEAKYSGAETWYSYTITGTDRDGIHEPYATDAGDEIEQEAGTTVTRIFNAIGNTATLLPKPIFLAAKYGGFTDMDGDGTPGYDRDGDGVPEIDDHREWDSRDNSSGASGKDGLPDNFFFSRNPALLASQLEQVLQDIANRVSSATNTALLSNSNTGTGVLYQALFQPEMSYNGRSIRWGGLLHALFVDSKGLLREDTNGNDQLDDYDTDNIVELKFDPNANQTMLQRYTTDDEGETQTVSGSLEPLTSLKTIWDARDQLAQIVDVVTQRTYESLASSGRYIFTWLDDNNDGVIDDGESLSFTASSFTGREGYLGVSATEAASVVNYVRGQESEGFRSRTIDYDGDGDEDIWRLGDVVHSTPQLVAAPDSRYDALYQDATYQAFRAHYLNRRHVLYVGANDGMVHAFNGGFWNETDYSYSATGGNGESSHPLGSELWAYTPMNLLPHLRWLKEQSYPHVYYMDGEPLVFDANIFDPEDSHYPGGWGTVLVIGMRLGGGALDVTVNGNDRTMRSAYVVLDVTNPEQPPKLIAEITHPRLGLTTAKPVLVKRRVADTGSSGENDWNKDVLKNEWYLIFASGPYGEGEEGVRGAIGSGNSDQNLRVFAYDLASRSFVTGLDPLVSNLPASYAGDMTAVDWDSDYQDDVVYFGSVDTSSSALSGKILRLELSQTLSESQISTLLDVGKPVTAAPVTLRDNQDYWVYSGTGRLLTYSDNSETGQQFFYGLKEPMSNGALSYGSLSLDNVIDTTQVEVLSSGAIVEDTPDGYGSFEVDNSTVSNFDALKSIMQSKSGWRIGMNHDGQNPAGRSVSSASRLFSLLFFTEYQPSLNSCRADGRSYLNGVHYQTGTATPEGVIDYVEHKGEKSGQVSVSKILVGIGYASAPVIHQGEGGRRSAVTQGAGGSIDRQALGYGFSSSGRMSWRQIFDIPWLGQ